MHWITVGFLAFLTAAAARPASAETARPAFAEIRKAQTSVAVASPEREAAREQGRPAFQELNTSRKNARSQGFAANDKR